MPPLDDGPSPPVPPTVINRDAHGRATARAVRIADAIQIDGSLDEPVYSQIASISDFIQNDPNEGEPATEKPEFWILFDDDTVDVHQCVGSI